MDAWLVNEYVWELPLDTLLSLCARINLNNTLPQLLFFALGIRRAGLYHGLRMPTLRVMMCILFVLLLSFDILGLSSSACGVVIFSVFGFAGQVNFYAPGFIEMFSTTKGFMAFLLSSPYFLFFGAASLLGIWLDRMATSRSIFAKKCASWYWFGAVFLFLPVMLILFSELERVFSHRFFM